MADRLPLADRRILVTRPRGQGEALVAAIEERGGRAWLFPLLTIDALTDAGRIESCKQRILALDEYRHVIFISSNAVRFGAEWIEDYWPQLPQGIQWHGIGGSTCEAMRRANLPVATDFHTSHPMNSEALLQLPALQRLNGQKVLIVKGVGGREYLQDQLAVRGARVDIAECYRRSGPRAGAEQLLDLIRGQHIGTICVNSGDSLANLCELLGDQLADVLDRRLVVPGQRVYRLAVERGFQRVISAANASDSAVLAALLGVETNNH